MGTYYTLTIALVCALVQLPCECTSAPLQSCGNDLVAAQSSPPSDISNNLRAMLESVYTGHVDRHGIHYLGFHFTEDRNVSLVLNPDGTVTYKEFAFNDPGFHTMGTRINPPADPFQAAAEGWVTATFSELVPPGSIFNGVLIVPNGNLRIKGTLDGTITIGVFNTDGDGHQNLHPDGTLSTSGNVWIEGDILYRSGVHGTPESGALLGIVAENHLIVAESADNKEILVTHGVFMSTHKGAIVERLETPETSIGGSRREWHIHGEIHEGSELDKMYGSSKGLDLVVHKDGRLITVSPPFFPDSPSRPKYSKLED